MPPLLIVWDSRGATSSTGLSTQTARERKPQGKRHVFRANLQIKAKFSKGVLKHLPISQTSRGFFQIPKEHFPPVPKTPVQQVKKSFFREACKIFSGNVPDREYCRVHGGRRIEAPRPHGANVGRLPVRLHRKRQQALFFASRDALRDFF